MTENKDKYWLITVKFIENHYDYEMEHIVTTTAKGSLVTYLNERYSMDVILLNSLEITEMEYDEHEIASISKRIID